jgi:hypothetical protein
VADRTVSLEVTGYISQPYGGTRLLAIDPSDPSGRVVPLHPDRLTEDHRDMVVRCNCADIPPTLGTERDTHLKSCPFSLSIFEEADNAR